MKFLVDNAVSPTVCKGLSEGGFDSIHVRDVGLSSASDAEIFDLAFSEGRILVSADADFGMLLALRRTRKPFVILFRSGAEKKPARQLDLLKANLQSIREALEEGSLVVFEPMRIRVRRLPILGE